MASDATHVSGPMLRYITTTWGLGSGFRVESVWLRVEDFCCMICGSWFMVYGLWFMV